MLDLEDIDAYGQRDVDMDRYRWIQMIDRNDINGYG